MTEQTTAAKPRPTTRYGVGMPATLHLNSWARDLREAFGEVPYLVGTAARFKQWRDVDVRLVLDDNEFDALFPGHIKPDHINPLWSLLCASISELGRIRTGLPIDFQIQRRTDANTLYSGCVRHPLGLNYGGHR